VLGLHQLAFQKFQVKGHVLNAFLLQLFCDIDVPYGFFSFRITESVVVRVLGHVVGQVELDPLLAQRMHLVR